MEFKKQDFASMELGSDDLERFTCCIEFIVVVSSRKTNNKSPSKTAIQQLVSTLKFHIILISTSYALQNNVAQNEAATIIYSTQL